MSDIAIQEHGFLSDCGSSALVTRAGSVDWLCTPRFDSHPVFARLLDHDAGHFSIRPVADDAHSQQRYRGASLVLDTTWSTSEGSVKATDAFALGKRERGHDLGRSAPGVLLRTVTGTSGTVRMRVDFSPRPEFGLIRPRLSRIPDGVVAEAGAQTLVLSTDVDLEIVQASAVAEVELRQGESITFALEVADAWSDPPGAWSRRKVLKGIDRTMATWESWSVLHQSYDGPWRDLVLRSGVVLRGLSYARTGAIVAAATSSLPEGVDSGRTWDYRYTWVRDASMTMQGLFVAACPDEAGRFFSFLSRSASSQLDEGLQLQIMFGIAGERDLSERELPHLRGWRNSGPVRVGNGAWGQSQLDVYGALLDAAHTLRQHLGDLDQHTRTFLAAAVDVAAERWTEQDQGIWEVRGEPRDFLHSKLMCWVALDRGIALAGLLGTDRVRLAHWHEAREEVRSAILDRGWNPRVGAFTQSFGSDELDASALMLAIVGFLPPDDERLRATIDVVERELSDGRGLLRRYVADDGLGTSEGTFLLCTFWLAQALALTGRPARAEEVLGRAVATAGPLGLFAEEVGADGELLGNFPQAFSHLGLVNAAKALQDAQAAEA